MSTVGTVDSLWRYPVKSMRGEELEEAFAGFSGVYGDRYFAFKSTARPKGFPYLTGREQEQLLRYRPRFRQHEKAAEPRELRTPLERSRERVGLGRPRRLRGRWRAGQQSNQNDGGARKTRAPQRLQRLQRLKLQRPQGTGGALGSTRTIHNPL